jgi:hypothetical protein
MTEHKPGTARSPLRVPSCGRPGFVPTAKYSGQDHFCKNITAASVRLWAPSLSKTFLTCSWTV